MFRGAARVCVDLCLAVESYSLQMERSELGFTVRSYISTEVTFVGPEVMKCTGREGGKWPELKWEGKSLTWS